MIKMKSQVLKDRWW